MRGAFAVLTFCLAAGVFRASADATPPPRDAKFKHHLWMRHLKESVPPTSGGVSQVDIEMTGLDELEMWFCVPKCNRAGTQVLYVSWVRLTPNFQILGDAKRCRVDESYKYLYTNRKRWQLNLPENKWIIPPPVECDDRKLLGSAGAGSTSIYREFRDWHRERESTRSLELTCPWRVYPSIWAQLVSEVPNGEIDRALWGWHRPPFVIWDPVVSRFLSEEVVDETIRTRDGDGICEEAKVARVDFDNELLIWLQPYRSDVSWIPFRLRTPTNKQGELIEGAVILIRCSYKDDNDPHESISFKVRDIQ